MERFVHWVQPSFAFQRLLKTLGVRRPVKSLPSICLLLASFGLLGLLDLWQHAFALVAAVAGELLAVHDGQRRQVADKWMEGF